MPSVPLYGGPQVREAAAPNVKIGADTSLATFGGGNATEGLFKASAGLLDAVAKAKDDADEATAKAAANNLKKIKTDLLWSPQTGALSQQGENAFGIIDKYGSDFKAKADELSKGLSNENQRRYFKTHFDSENNDLHDSLSKHMFKETEKFADDQSESLISNYRNDAILNYNDPNKIRSAMESQDSEIFNYAKRKGLPSSWVQAKIQDSESKTHLGVVQAYLSSDQDQIAKQYFEANQSGFTAGDKQSIMKSLEEGTLRGESQRLSDSIFAQHNESMSSALAETRKIKDPKLRDETMRRVEANFAMKSRAEREDSENLHIKALNQIDQTGQFAIDKIPGWERFTVGERKSLESYAEMKSKGQEPKTDWVTYYDKMQLAQNPETKDAFLQENLMKYRGSLADAEFKQLVGLQSGLRKNDPKADKLLDGYRSDSMIVNDALSAAGFKTGSSASDKDKEAVSKVRRMVDGEIVKLQTSTGKKASNEEVQKIVDSLMLKGKVKGSGWLWDDTKRVFELSPDDAAAFMPEVPDDEKKSIEASLKKKGQSVTDENIVKMYLQGLKGSSSAR
jgi:hypothetical protein